jgi:hypothetical protein
MRDAIRFELWRESLVFQAHVFFEVGDEFEPGHRSILSPAKRGNGAVGGLRLLDGDME